ncbi:MAG: hypothetical protein ACJAZT_002054 [Gammaproteobacteria bacterium]|jgi:hypothetical protein
MVNYVVLIMLDSSFAKSNEVRTLQYRVLTLFRSRIVASLTVHRKPGEKANRQIS